MEQEDLIYDLISTRKMRKFTFVSIQNMRDHDEILDRIRQNGIKTDLVIEILENIYGRHVTVDYLLSFARKLSKKINIRIDRLANRNRSALICWYAENWNAIYPHLNDFNSCCQKQTYYEEKCDNKSNLDLTIDPSDIQQLLNQH